MIEKFGLDGRAIAHARISSFDEQLVAEFATKGLLETFRDPGFQILLNRAQLQAASTEDQADHELITKLLVGRASQRQKTVHLAVSRAVETVDSLDDETLTGLTLLWYTLNTQPATTDPLMSLKFRDNAYGKLLQTAPLPSGTRWLDDLDLLGLMNCDFSQARYLKNLESLAIERRPGLFGRGLAADEAKHIQDRLRDIDRDLASLLTPHSLIPGQFRLNVVGKESCQELADSHQLPRDRREKLEEIFEICGIGTVDQKARDKATELIEGMPNYSTVRAWFNEFNTSIDVRITAAGVAIAYSNANRFIDVDGLGTLAEVLDKRK
ncbi:hypothetical protein O7631_21000 [Micromonospora sp. WMMD967]|nr:LPO_1073/Vpar_1526 family protein [Micromonospora sp. WMMD967]MDG4839002.1 hypothetical protein [Micromonospora sp. WMMD967]